MVETPGSGGARTVTTVDAAVEKCPRCFAELLQTWQFCPSCGLPLDPAHSSDGQVTSTSISYVSRTDEPAKKKRASLTESLVQSGLHLLVLMAFVGITVGGIIVLSPGVLRRLVSPIEPPTVGQPAAPPVPDRGPDFTPDLPTEFRRIKAEVFRPGDPDVRLDPDSELRLDPEKDPFYRDFDISQYEITNYQFLQYLRWRRENDETGFTWSRETELFAEDWRDEDYVGQPIPNSRQASFPVRGVTFDEAQAYARWAGRELGATIRLPYWFEWEKAARGTDGRRYPWGDEWDRQRCNTKEFGLTRPVVGSVFDDRDVSPDGVCNMAGNVSEWVDGNPDSGTKYVMGGAYDADRYYAQTWVKNDTPPFYRARYLGFRVVREIEEKDE